MKYGIDLETLKSEIRRRGFNSVEELSEKSRINKRELMLVLKGKRLPAMDLMVELAAALELSPERSGEIFFNKKIRNTYKNEGLKGQKE